MRSAYDGSNIASGESEIKIAAGVISRTAVVRVQVKEKMIMMKSLKIT